jgi:hypothetical protein
MQAVNLLTSDLSDVALRQPAARAGSRWPRQLVSRLALRAGGALGAAR